MIEINKPQIGNDEIASVTKTLESGTLSSANPDGGPMVQKLEELVREKTNSLEAIAVNSGTSALYASLLALDIGKDDEVILPSFTFVATANVVHAVGARPVFADIDTDYTINWDDVIRKITPKTKAIIPVHIFGRMCKFPPLDLDIPIIEDACQALGSSRNSIQAGNIGKVGCFSMYPSKIITSGEGGIITTDDLDLAKKLRAIRNHGFTDDWSKPGYNLRMSEIHAALAVPQMEKIDHTISLRTKIYHALNDELHGLHNKGFFYVNPPDHETIPNHYMFPIEIYNGNRDMVERAFRKRDVYATPYYRKPIHHIPFYKPPYELEYTDDIATRILSLPLHTGISSKDIKLMADILYDILLFN